jgi:aldehyde:ferredoxin oxidoreductase
MEAYERGIVTKDMLGGIEAEFGNSDAMIALINKIAFRQDFGNVMAEGTKYTSEYLGGIAEEFAVHVRGMGFPAHDPRTGDSIGLQYALSPRGACHMSAFTHGFEVGGEFPGFGVMEPFKMERFSTEKRHELVMKMENLMCLCDSLTCCKFIIFGFGEETINMLTQWLNWVTGWDMTPEEFIAAGERIYNLKRLYLNRDGQSRKDDKLPQRMRKRRGTGGAPENIPDVDGMLDKYYEFRGWDEFGIPNKETKNRLQIG